MLHLSASLFELVADVRAREAIDRTDVFVAMEEGMKRTFPRLEQVTNWAILLTALFCAVLWARAFLVTPSASSDSSAYYAPGEVIPPIQNLHLSKAPRTLIFVVSSSCRFCTESMPFYQDVVRQRDVAKSDVQLIVLGQEDQSSLEAYLSNHDVQPDAVVSVLGVQGLKVSRTPTILEVDSDSEVMRAWYGRLSDGAEEAVVKAVLAAP